MCLLYDYGSNNHAGLEKKCLLYGVSALECPLWRGFIIRDSLGIHPGQNFLSVLERFPLYRMSALGRFHCISSHREARDIKFGHQINIIERVSLGPLPQAVVISLAHNYLKNLFILSCRGAVITF